MIITTQDLVLDLVQKQRDTNLLNDFRHSSLAPQEEELDETSEGIAREYVSVSTSNKEILSKLSVLLK